jgi:hypothetical protein
MVGDVVVNLVGAADMNVDANSGDQVQVAVAVKRRRPRLQGQRKPPRAI